MYSIGGTLAVLVQFAVLVALIELWAMRELYASMLGLAAAIPVNFMFQRYFVFKKLDKLADRLARYCIVTGITFTLNAILFYVLVDIAVMPYLLGQAITTGLILLINYWANATWTFKAHTAGT